MDLEVSCTEANSGGEYPVPGRKHLCFNLLFKFSTHVYPNNIESKDFFSSVTCTSIMGSDGTSFELTCFSLQCMGRARAFSNSNRWGNSCWSGFGPKARFELANHGRALPDFGCDSGSRF
jgi:hypothetical protein